ncbi:MAG: hypothetical protein PHF56_24325 [Desulfuromonadaceae bacterium]|nr:hypothetical protein [Desulfuromonadaceae bacterium]
MTIRERSGFWFLDMMRKMDPEELQAIIDVLYPPENHDAVIRLSRTCEDKTSNLNTEKGENRPVKRFAGAWGEL